MKKTDPIKILSIVEAATVTGPARNLLDFFESAKEPRADGEAFLLPELATYHRSRAQVAADITPNEFVARARSQGISLEVIGERFPFDLRVVEGLRQTVSRRMPHIVETHHVKSHFLLRLSRAWKNRPWIAFHHGYTMTDTKVRLYNHLDRWSLRAAHRVITVSEAFKRDLMAIGVPEQRIHVLHNSIDPQWFGSLDGRNVRTQFGLDPEERVILAVGRFSREKALADLVTAFAQLRKTRPQTRLRLILVGDGPERLSVEQLAADLGVKEQILFAGQVSDPRPYYAAAEILAMPSLSEGSPLALLEAMAAALPIVATAVGGVPEIVQDGQSALLVPAAQPQALAEALGRVLDDTSLAQNLGEQARQTAQNRFTPEAHRKARMAIYQDLLSNSRTL